MGVLSGYLNTDAEIMQNQREYDAETKRKKEEAIALAASDQKKWEKSLIKDAINNNNTFYTTMLKEKAKGMDGKACWKGYSLRGTKMKGGKRVDNCVKN